jgi:predicted metallo-beta-lactamase superfamily hydrolase
LTVNTKSIVKHRVPQHKIIQEAINRYNKKPDVIITLNKLHLLYEHYNIDEVHTYKTSGITTKEMFEDKELLDEVISYYKEDIVMLASIFPLNQYI